MINLSSKPTFVEATFFPQNNSPVIAEIFKNLTNRIHENTFIS